MTTFVSYYVDISESEKKKLGLIYRLLTRQERYFPENPKELLALMFASVKKFHPDARLCLITDGSTKLDLDPSIEIIRYPRQTDQLDQEVLFGLIHYLKNSPRDENTIFLEWDHLVQSNLDSIFLVKTDLYFTYRKVRPFPIDAGFIAIGGGKKAQIIDFLELLYTQYDQLITDKFRCSLGLSFILSLMIYDLYKGRSKESTKRVVAFKYKEIVIGVLSGSEYNAKPLREKLLNYLPNVKVIHFKNARKKEMKQYWEKYLTN